MSEHAANTTLPHDSVLARHGVAILSLFISIAALGYTAWRNELTESHRNVREASFRLLTDLGEFQQLVDQRHYGGDHSDANRINAWGKVTLIRDMSMLVSPKVGVHADELFVTWQNRADEVSDPDNRAELEISEAADNLRKSVLVELESLQ